MIFSILSSIFLLKPFLLFFHLVFSYQVFFFKLAIILLLLETFILIKYGEEFKMNKLSKLKKNNIMMYKIINKKDLFLSLSYTFSYISIFILGILYLRIQNQNHEINLVKEYIKIKEKILHSSIPNNIISFILIFLLIVTVITIYKKLLNLFKFHLKKIHIYLYQYEIYDEIFWNTFSNKYPSPLTKIPSYTLQSIHHILISDWLQYLAYLLRLVPHNPQDYRKTSPNEEKPTWDYIHNRINLFTWRHAFHIHYIILFIILFLDTSLNNFTLKNYFFFLPFFFIYHNWIRFSCTVDQMGFGPSHDLMRLLYRNCHREDDLLYTENGEFVCNMSDGFEFLITYLETFVHPDLQDYQPKGKIVSMTEKLISFILSTKIVKRIRKYNYRRQIIKIHKILTLQIKK